MEDCDIMNCIKAQYFLNGRVPETDILHDLFRWTG